MRYLFNFLPLFYLFDDVMFATFPFPVYSTVMLVFDQMLMLFLPHIPSVSSETGKHCTVYCCRHFNDSKFAQHRHNTYVSIVLRLHAGNGCRTLCSMLQ